MMSEDQATSIGRRPFGVWLLTIAIFVVLLLWILMTAPWYLFPPRHAQLPPDVIGWLLLFPNIALLGASYGTWAGSKRGRDMFLASWAFISALLAYSMASGIIGMRRDGYEEKWINDALLEGTLTMAVMLSWVGFLFWYFLRPRARLFFEHRSASSPWHANRGMVIAALAPTALIFGGIETVYHTTGAPSRPPLMLADELRVSPGGKLSPDEQFSQFIQIRQGPNIWETDASQKFTALLQKRFPAGTTEANLVSALRKEGFSSPPIAGIECTPSGEIPKPGSNLSTCNYDSNPEKTLEYGWWRFASWQRDRCLEEVHVHWSAEDKGRDFRSERRIHQNMRIPDRAPPLDLVTVKTKHPQELLRIEKRPCNPRSLR